MLTSIASSSLPDEDLKILSMLAREPDLDSGFVISKAFFPGPRVSQFPVVRQVMQDLLGVIGILHVQL